MPNISLRQQINNTQTGTTYTRDECLNRRSHLYEMY